ncbi:hypothetical protein TCAL_13060 [Tigriopus californicus]|uniref:Uncharacterized protein n=1 Tax=Tigriopus californicus TaxID=6832 RepID=A0A553PN88_TIGCA|nr:uncharacterized protein LOC131881595 [Tigriopus californicus]TRY79149.1 hypothetical protein TCAL_13060 [Tigriopus californicus]|eukprot:TCALIF_13060-PA protein Name:"Protein of unknown function" AED:0.00 eAED:0.00 QI:98/1/1/1/0.5/0.66/3/259/170
MAQIAKLWILCCITIVAAQLSDHQPEENYYSHNQVSPASDPNNPWANYQNHIQPPHYYAYSNVDRQGILNSPEGVAIAVVAAGGAVGLGGLGLAVADTRQTTNRLTQRQDQICSNTRDIATQLDAVVQALVSTITLSAMLAPTVAASGRQLPNVEQTFESIRSSIPKVNC